MTRRIACGHCGQSHPTVAEVRACSASNPIPDGPDEPTGPEPPPEPFRPAGAESEPVPRSSSATTTRAQPRSQPTERRRQPASGRPTPRPAVPALDLERRPVAALAGPAALGRSVLLGPDDPVPEPWADAEEIRASADCDDETTAALHAAWRQRRPVVIRWDGPLPDEDPILDIPFHQLSPRAELPGERLRFAVTANAVDLRHPHPRFEPISAAVAAGATLTDPAGSNGAESDPASAGDVVTGDGPAWADGGPLTELASDHLGGLPLLPRPHLVAGLVVAQSPEPGSPGAELAPDQLAAVAHGGGPARIIAPAGSGKTRVLTERTRHLVLDRGLRASTVSLVAYNRRAREEMADRLTDIAGLDIRTLNSLALAIATGTGPFTAATSAGGGGGRRPTTIDEIDARRLLDRIVPGRRRRQLTDPLEPWVDALSACRLGLRDPHEVEAAYGGDITGFPEVLERYRQELAGRNELDFDEQILRAIEVLLTDPAARRDARRAAPILLIDEFQDLTPAHLLLVRLLAGPAGEVFAVGDDDQTIYGYSGASPDWLVHFDRYFPGAEDHPLTVNYRCPAPVVDAARNLLSHNRNRVAKTIVSGASDTGTTSAAGDTGPLVVNGGDDPNRRLVAHVGQLLDGGAAPGDVAVLARVNAALLPALVHLAEAGIPVARPYGVDGRMLERSGVGAALAWLRLATGPEQRLRADDLRLALRRPPRSLHPRIADWACEQRSVKDLVALSGRLNRERDAALVADFAADIERLRTAAEASIDPETGTADAVALLDTVLDDLGLLGAASQLDQSQRTARRAAHSDELAAIRAVATLGVDPLTFETWLQDRLDAIPRHDDPERGDAVTLATIHTTKGLEWPHVVVHDVRGDLHPHRLATDIEEERRIFHVAFTRCRASVLINAVPTDAGPRSPFLAEMAEARPADQPWPEPEASTAADRTVARRDGGAKGPKATRSEPGSPLEAARRQALTEWRTARCKADGVPAYIVLGNATLDAIAASGPASLVALGRIKGIGPAKLDRYGDDILGVLADVGDTAGA